MLMDEVSGNTSKKPLTSSKLVLLLSFLTNIFILANYNGTYWDDYAWLNQDFDVIKQGWEMAHGSAWVYGGGIFVLASELGVFPFRLLFLIANISIVFFCYHILSQVRVLSEFDKVTICTLMSVTPYFEVGFFIIHMPYTISIALFYLAFFLFIKWQKKMTNQMKILVASLFFVSFLTNSIVFYYAFFLIYVLFKEYKKDKTAWMNLLTFSKHNFIFILLPIFFLIIRYYYFMPNGLYEGYNAVSIQSLFFSVPQLVPKLLYENLVILTLKFVEELLKFWWAIVPLSLVIAIRFPQNNNVISPSIHIALIACGSILFLMAAYPYLAAGHIPTLFGVNSRHQLLLPFSFSVVCYFAMSLILRCMNAVIKTFAISLVILTFFSLKIDAYVRYHIDWIYQQSVVENFRSNSLIRNGSTFSYTVNGSDTIVRPISYYAINALAKTAFDDVSRLIIYSPNKNHEPDLDRYEHVKKYKQYNAYSWEQEPLIIFSISASAQNSLGSSRFNKIKYIAMVRYLELSDEIAFKEVVKPLITLTFHET